MKNQKITTLTLGTLIGALGLFLVSCIEEEFNPNLTREFSIPSAFTGATYKIKVGLPLNYNSSSEKYSTVYVLDGEENFDFVSNHCKEISDRYSVDNVLVVSIGYGNDREMDYTPTKTSSKTGGGKAFLDFIEGELIPRIEHDFSADTARSSRVILGHSYGGLFGTYAMAVNNQLFGNYILLSPSIWYDNEVCLLLEKEKSEANRDRKQLVFLGIGESENLGRMQAPFEALYQILHNNYSSISLSKNQEDNLDHMGSKNPNIIKGLTYYFKSR